EGGRGIQAGPGPRPGGRAGPPREGGPAGRSTRPRCWWRGRWAHSPRRAPRRWRRRARPPRTRPPLGFPGTLRPLRPAAAASCVLLADEDPAALLAPDHFVGRRGADAPEVNGVERQVAALTPAVAQCRGPHRVLGTQPVVEVEEVRRQVGGDGSAAVAGPPRPLVDLREP